MMCSGRLKCKSSDVSKLELLLLLLFYYLSLSMIMISLFSKVVVVEGKKPVKVDTNEEKSTFAESNQTWVPNQKNSSRDDGWIVPSSYFAPADSLRYYHPKEVIVETINGKKNTFWRHLTSFAVIVPTHNNAETIIETLESVEKSIEYFSVWYPSVLIREFGLTDQEVLQKPWRGEVIVVDDASTDNTVPQVASWIHSKQIKSNHYVSGKAIWKCLSLMQNVKSGAARNFGVRATSGDILFFVDGDDLFLSEHIFLHFYFLMKTVETSVYQSGISVDVPGIHPRWKARIENTSPMSKSIYRKLYWLIEGFPEQPFFQRHEDFAWATMLIEHAHMSTMSIDTSIYVRYVNNSLDKQADKFRKDPNLEIKQLQAKGMDDVEEMEAREVLIKTHLEHLKEKITSLREGREGEESTDSHWAIYQSTIDRLKWDYETWSGKLNAKKVAFKRFLSFSGAVAQAHSEIAMEAGKFLYRLGHNYVFDVKEYENSLIGLGFAVLLSSEE